MQVVSRHSLEPAQRTRLQQFSAQASVDIHCHCLPDLDDGPQSLEQSIELCRALVADGITHAIATPHQMGRYTGTNGRTAVLESVAMLREQLDLQHIPLMIEAGAEVRIDENIIRLLISGEIFTLTDGNAFLLLELPNDVLIDPLPLLRQLDGRGIRAVITHPERQTTIARKPELVAPWLRAGAILQVTAASVMGEFGPQAHAAVWQLLEAGAVSLMASDAHDTGKRPPRMTHAITAISARLGHAVARRLCIENPWKILSGQQIQPAGFSRRMTLV